MRPVLLSRSNDIQTFCVGVSVNRELGRMGAGAACSPPNEWRLSCGALEEDSFLNLRSPPASSAC